MYKRADRVITLCEIRHNTNPISITDARKILKSFPVFATGQAQRSKRSHLHRWGGYACERRRPV